MPPSSSSAYNDLKSHLLAFCDCNQISAEDTNFFERIWIRKAKNSGEGNLIEWKERDRMRSIFEHIEQIAGN